VDAQLDGVRQQAGHGYRAPPEFMVVAAGLFWPGAMRAPALRAAIRG